MESNNKKEEQTKKLQYEKPMIQEEKEMVFTKEVWDEFNDGNWCFGCTNCNCN